MTAPRRIMLGALLALSLSACLPEPTPPLERPEGLEPIGAARSEAPAAEPRQPQALDTEAAVAGPVVFGMFAAAAARLLELPLGNESGAFDAERRPLGVLAVAANTRGELNLCECKDRRRGGLARRASALGALRQLATDPGEKPIVVDVGDALSATLATPASGDEALAERAEVVLAALGAMELDAMLVNVRDLRVGVERLQALARDHDVPLVSSNLVAHESREPVFETGRLIERGELQLGLVGLTSAHRTNPRLLRELGLAQLEAEDAVARASATLREQSADAIVLLSGLGMRETEALLEGWRDADTRPDLALVSGTARLTSEPSWAGGVAVLEPGDRGRQLLVVRLYPDEAGELTLARATGKGLERTELVEVLRRIAVMADSIERRARVPSSARRAVLTQRVDALREALDDLAARVDVLERPPQPSPVPALEVEVVELPYTLVPDARVQRLVDRVEKERPEPAPGRVAPPPPRPQRPERTRP